MRTVLCLISLTFVADANACHRNANGLTADCLTVNPEPSQFVVPSQPQPVTYYAPVTTYSAHPVTYYQQAPVYREQPARSVRIFRSGTRSSGNCTNGSCPQ